MIRDSLDAFIFYSIAIMIWSWTESLTVILFTRLLLSELRRIGYWLSTLKLEWLLGIRNWNSENKVNIISRRILNFWRNRFFLLFCGNCILAIQLIFIRNNLLTCLRLLESLLLLINFSLFFKWKLLIITCIIIILRKGCTEYNLVYILISKRELPRELHTRILIYRLLNLRFRFLELHILSSSFSYLFYFNRSVLIFITRRRLRVIDSQILVELIRRLISFLTIWWWWIWGWSFYSIIDLFSSHRWYESLAGNLFFFFYNLKISIPCRNLI